MHDPCRALNAFATVLAQIPDHVQHRIIMSRVLTHTSAYLRQGLAPLIDLLYPPRCPLCGNAIGTQSGLCTPCWSALEIPSQPNCKICQRQLSGEIQIDTLVCGRCMVDPPSHDGVSAATLYNDTARGIVLGFKRGRKLSYAPMMANQMSARLPNLEGEWLVVPVPLHRGRLWQRGFNQSALLAREIAKIKGWSLLVDGLVRIKPTPPLGHSGSDERAEILADAIIARRKFGKRITGAQVLLVDDVLASGATSNACIAALRGAGAGVVRIACFARSS